MCQTPSVYRSERVSDVFPRQTMCQISLQVTIKHAANAFAGQQKKPSNVLTGHHRRCQIIYRSPQSVSNIFTSHQMACETSLQVTTKLVKRLYMSPQTISNFSQVTTERVSLYRSPQGVSNVFTGHHRACQKTVQVTTERVKPLYRSPKTV